MIRRDFNRIALGAGLSPLLSRPTLAQWYEGQSPPTQEPPKQFNIVVKHSPRTYNQVNVPRKPAAGRRFSIYWTWSYPWEANRDVTELDNRFSTMTEVRRVAWPNYEKPEYSEKVFLQGIAGTLELFHLSTVRFQTIVGEVMATARIASSSTAPRPNGYGSLRQRMTSWCTSIHRCSRSGTSR
jgi:hypothetical protein